MKMRSTYKYLTVYRGLLLMFIVFRASYFAISADLNENLYSEEEHSLFMEELFEGYDDSIRPKFNSVPVLVECNMFVQSIDSMQETTMSYSMLIFMRQNWNDPRLKFTKYNESISIHTKFLDKIWFADLFFAKEKKGHFHEITTDNKLLRLFPNGDILYSARISLTLSCAMKLQNFPFDIQICSNELESFGFTTKDLIFKWKEEDPVQVSQDLQLPQFTLAGYQTDTCTKTYNTGNYTCIKVSFALRRQLGYYFIQTYTPSVLIVILSWVSFWISAESSPARVALGITTVLTMTTQSSAANDTLPKVSYIKAIDIWIAVCLLFVFSSLVEFAGVNYMSRKYAKKCKLEAEAAETRSKVGQKLSHGAGIPADPQAKQNGRSIVELANVDNGAHQYTRTVMAGTSVKSKAEEFGNEQADKIDFASRFFFPAAFCIFNIVYWSYYLVSYNSLIW